MRKLLIGMLLAASGAWASGDAPKTAADNAMKDAAKTASSEVTGQVKKFDASTRSLTLALPSGDQQLQIASDAKITRDGSAIGLAELKAGDNVRASFDPLTHEALTLDVTSKAAVPNKDALPMPKEPEAPKSK